MKETIKLPEVNLQILEMLVKSQRSIVEKYDKSLGSNRKNQGVLYRYYREPTYFYVNFVLKEGRMPTAIEAEKHEAMEENEVMSTIVQLDEIFDQIKPLSAPIVVYKCVSLDSIQQYTSIKQFQSTSFILSKAYETLYGKGRYMFKITIPVGIKAIFTGNELGDVILDRDTKIVVTSLKPIALLGEDVPMFDAFAIKDNMVTLEEFIKKQRSKLKYRNVIFEEIKDQIQCEKTLVENMSDGVNEDNVFGLF